MFTKSTCTVTESHSAFPAVCGAFVFSEYNYLVTVASYTLKAKVHAGKISCTGESRNDLVEASIAQK